VKRYGLELGCSLELGFGLLGGLQRGLSGQVRQVRFFPSFSFSFSVLFSVFNFYFEFSFEFNSVCRNL
jgi:hypothetical protein